MQHRNVVEIQKGNKASFPHVIYFVRSHNFLCLYLINSCWLQPISQRQNQNDDSHEKLRSLVENRVKSSNTAEFLLMNSFDKLS